MEISPSTSNVINIQFPTNNGVYNVLGQLITIQPRNNMGIPKGCIFLEEVVKNKTTKCDQLPETERRKNIEYTHWSREVTLRLLHEYKTHHKKVGISIRNLKFLYELIAENINKEFGLTLTGSQVNNKFKTLERSYKNVVDSKKTGRGRKFFEYEGEMDEISKNSKKIHPEILLCENAVIEPTCLEKPMSARDEKDKEPEIQIVQCSNYNNHAPEKNLVKNCKTPKKIKKTRNDILEALRQDRLIFQQEHLKLLKEKVNAEKENK